MAHTKQRQSENLVGLFHHSLNEYTLKEFVDAFKRKLPKIFVVTQGFYGVDDMHSIASDEIYRIEKIVKQPRVVLKQKDGTELSIPEEYKFSKFQYLSPDGKASKPMELKQIIKEKKSKLKTFKFQLENDSEAGFMIGNEGQSSTSLGILDFVDTYHERYLIGNPMIQGKFAPTAIALPVYVDINVSDVTSMKKGTTIKLEDYLKKLPLHMQQALDKYELNEDISMLPKDYTVDKSDPDYQYIIPEHYMTLVIKEKNQSSRKSILNPLKAEFQEVPLAEPNEYSYLEPRLQGREKPAPVPSIQSLPLPSPPVERVRESHHGYEKLKPSIKRENPYGTRPIYNSLSEVPVDLSELSKYRIADCLRLLNLENHADRFIMESVDGNLASALDENMLMQEFEFTKFEAIKLMGFIRGWRPVEEAFL